MKSSQDSYGDLDEIFSRYIEPMNDYVAMMMKSRYFMSGSPSQVCLIVKCLKLSNSSSFSCYPYFSGLSDQNTR